MAEVDFCFVMLLMLTTGLPTVKDGWTWWAGRSVVMAGVVPMLVG